MLADDGGKNINVEAVASVRRNFIVTDKGYNGTSDSGSTGGLIIAYNMSSGASPSLLMSQGGVDLPTAELQKGLIDVGSFIWVMRNGRRGGFHDNGQFQPIMDFPGSDRGFFRADGSPRPSATFLQNLLAFLGPDTIFTTPNPPYVIVSMSPSNSSGGPTGGAVNYWTYQYQDIIRRSTDGHWLYPIYRDTLPPTGYRNETLHVLFDIPRNGRVWDLQSNKVMTTFSAQKDVPVVFCPTGSVNNSCLEMVEFDGPAT